MTIRIALLLLSLCSTAVTAEQPPTYDRINLSVSAGQEVENDTLVAVLFAQQEGTDASRLSSDVNRAIAKAVEQAKGSPGIKVQTLEYSTTPVYRNQVLSGWRVRQSVRLESLDGAALSGLISELQQSLAVQSISYAISPARRQQAEDQLIREAISAFSARAKMVTGELGRSDYRLVEMNLNSSGVSPAPYQMRGSVMAMQAEAAPPTLEAGTRRIEVNVSGIIELKP